MCKTRWFFSRMQFGRPHQISKFFSEIPLCTKYYFSSFFALGCSKGGHTCQWLSDVYYYGPGLLRSWWLVEILEHLTNWIIQLFFVFFFGGVSRGATCQCLSIVCYHEPGWLRSLCLVGNVGAHSFAMDVCWAGWGSANHYHMHWYVGRPHQISKFFFRNSPMYKILFFFFFCSGV